MKKHQIISTGFNNMKKSHPITHKYNKLPWSINLHAEVHCCIGVPMADLDGSDIYVYRILKNGDPAEAKSCQACVNFLTSVGVSKVYYTSDTGPQRGWNCEKLG